MFQVISIKVFIKEACFVKPSIFLVLNIYILLISSIQSAFSQDYNFEVQKIPLKGEFINFSGQCFLQDMDGFIWFGSKEGLYRYQGTSVKVYRHDPDNENSLSDNFVYDLCEDSEGVIWIGTKNGLNRFDRYTETFRCFNHDSKDSTSIIGNLISKITEDKNHNLWIATLTGFSLFDRETETFKNYQIKREESDVIKGVYQISNLYPDKEDYLWLNSYNGVYRFHIPSGKYEKINGSENDYTWEVYMDRSGRSWFANLRGLYLYDLEQQTFTRFFIESKYSNKSESQHIRTLLEDAQGNIWIRTLGGVYCYSQQLDLKYSLEHDELYPDTYRNQDLTKELFVDNTGSIWFYTQDAINQIIPKGINFRIYDFDMLVSAWINCIYPENRDLIWYGTMYGINSLDRRNNDIRLFHGDTIWRAGYPHHVYTIYPDRSGTIWFGTRTEGLYSLGKSEKAERELQNHKGEASDSIDLRRAGLSYINFIFEDNRGRLWISSTGYKSLHYYDVLNHKVVRLVDNPSAKNRLPEWNGVIRHQIGSDTLLSISSSGVYKIILPLLKISVDTVMPTDVIRCRLIDEDGHDVESPHIYMSYMDNSGNIWLGTHRQGLKKVLGKSKPGMVSDSYRVKSYSLNEGLPAQSVLSMLHDGKDNLWMGTENGLSKFNIASETFTNYFVRHGLPANEFRSRSAATSDDGELFFGTIAGMISFYPDSVHLNQHIAPVRITAIRINNQSLQPGENSNLNNSIRYTDKIEIRHNQNNISFEFAILNYNNPELNQYRYKLEGLNDKWIYAGNRTYVDFTNLDPGKYTFIVLGSNNDGIWNKEGRRLGIVIHPPPWLSWYAWVVYGIILAWSIFWYRSFIRKKAKLRMAIEIEKVENEKLLELDHMKSRFFANISHEFRTPLTLIAGPLDDLDKQETETISLKREVLGIMKRNTARLRNLINQLLDITRMETGTVKLTVTEGKLNSFISAILQSFLSLAESKNIKYTFQLSGSDLLLWYDEDKIEKILVNLLSNAFKFTPENGEIRIQCDYINSIGREDPDYLSLKISDNGIGIPSDSIDRIFDRFYQVNDSTSRETEGTGIGLALTKELVEIYRGEIKAESVDGKGTTFKIKLPVAKDLFSEDEISVISEEIDKSEFRETFPETGTKHKIPSAIGPDNSKPIILIVEDNADLRTYISGNLSDRYRIQSAENGKRGFDLARDSIPDLVISDLMMPVMDGMELCALIKEDERTSHIPVIMLTARADRDSKLEGLKTGADDYIIKPFDAEELCVRVQNLIEQRKKLREKFRKDYFAPEQTEMSIPQKDQIMEKLLKLIENNYSDFEFTVDEMGRELHMSRAQFFRKVNALTGESPNELLKSYRMNKAAALLRSGNNNITGIMYEVGYRSSGHFASSFKKYFGVNPSKYRDGLG